MLPYIILDSIEIIFYFQSTYDYRQLRLFVYLLRALPVLLQNQNTLRTVVKYTPPSDGATPAPADLGASAEFRDKDEPTELVAATLTGLKSGLRRCVSDSDLATGPANDATAMLSLDDIKIHVASIVLGDRGGADDSDVTEATEECSSESELKDTMGSATVTRKVSPR